MKTIKTLLLLTVIVSCTPFATAQKIKIKDKIAYVDDKPYVKVSDCGNYDEDCSISNLEGMEIISIDNEQNPKAPGTYYKVMFKGLNTTMEMTSGMKFLIGILYKNNIVTGDGKLNAENVKALAKKFGNNISLKDVEED
ncbi:MAG: hypothetical protein QM710_12775 [Flavobacterium sp.]